MLLMAVPSEARGARLNEMVTAGNCPWCVIVSGCRTRLTWVKAFRGTALECCELVLVFVVTVVFASAVCKGASNEAAGVGVNCAD